MTGFDVVDYTTVANVNCTVVASICASYMTLTEETKLRPAFPLDFC